MRLKVNERGFSLQDDTHCSMRFSFGIKIGFDCSQARIFPLRAATGQRNQQHHVTILPQHNRVQRLIQMALAQEYSILMILLKCQPSKMQRCVHTPKLISTRNLNERVMLTLGLLTTRLLFAIRMNHLLDIEAAMSGKTLTCLVERRSYHIL